MKISIINGPNLNLLGKREPEKYGSLGFEPYLETLRLSYTGIEFVYFQSNIEGELVGRIQDDGFKCDGIILNAGAYTHYSVAIADAISAVSSPVVEVHITNTAAREEFRHTSMLARVCAGTIAGFGLDSYRLATEALIGINKEKKNR
jgi:3-dehydroquinate dehydratase-2